DSLLIRARIPLLRDSLSLPNPRSAELSHRSKHRTNSRSKSLHRARILSQPANNRSERLTYTLPKILNSRRNILNPLIKSLKKLLQIRVNMLNQLLPQLTHSSPRQRHSTSHRVRSTLRRPRKLVFHDLHEHVSRHFASGNHLTELLLSHPKRI